MLNDRPKKGYQKLGFIIIFLMIIAIFIAVPYLLQGDDVDIITIQLFFFSLMLAVIYLIRGSPTWMLIEFTCLILFLIFDFLNFYIRSHSYELIAYAFSISFLIIVIYDLTRTILRSSHINGNHVFGCLLAYFLAGIFWAKLYFISNMINPGSFGDNDQAINFHATNLAEFYNLQLNLIYYSFSTLTTLGIGDIFPTHIQTKALTALETIFGQIFLVTVIAKLINAWHRPLKVAVEAKPSEIDG